MKRYKRCGWFVVVLMSGLGLPAHAAPSLETINGIVAGFGPCGTIGVAPELSSFFTFAPGDQPFGSTRAACGYSGGYRTQTASTGLLTQHDSLGPVVLGPPINSPGSYSGTADSRASYGSLGAAAHSAIVGGLPEGEHALFNSVGAATFADSLTATSPLAPNGSVGSVSYLFHLDGSLSALGAPAAFFAGETYMALDIQHRGIGKIGVANATVRRGGLGTVKNGPPPAGWVTSTGSLSGGR